MVIGSTGGKLLVATPPLADPNFDRSVIYVLEHDERGALGVVINRPSDEELPDQLAPWRWHVAAPASVFTGGPVEPLAMIGVGQRRDDAGPRHHAGATPSALETIDLTADPHEAGVDRLRIFRGYAGWAPGQLEAELEAGAWLVLAVYPDDVFTAEPAELWRTVLRRQGGRLAWLAGAPTDLSMN